MRRIKVLRFAVHVCVLTLLFNCSPRTLQGAGPHSFPISQPSFAGLIKSCIDRPGLLPHFLQRVRILICSTVYAPLINAKIVGIE